MRSSHSIALQIFDGIKKLLLFVVDLTFPPRETERLVSKRAPQIGVPQTRGHVVTLMPYADTHTQALIWECKYYSNKHATSRLGRVLAEYLLSLEEESIESPLLIPIPIHAKRRKERGYNQSEYLCESALTQAALALHYAPHVLIRKHHTDRQTLRSKEERLTNLLNSMEVTHVDLVRGRICLVVDDVSTTGATFAEAQRALLQAGAKEVRCVALAG